jgi:hypothetical protein
VVYGASDEMAPAAFVLDDSGADESMLDQEALRAQLASSAQYRRLVKRRGDKKAIVAVAHGILVIAYHLLRDGASYRELGGDYFDRLNIDRLTRYHTKRLAALGYTRCPVIGGCPSDTDRAS